MTKDLSELDSPDVGQVTLDLNVVREKAPTYTSEKLCEMIVCDRYFGCFRDVAIICMEELARRRAAGDVFNFESHIDEAYKKLPKLDFKIPNLRDVMQQNLTGIRGKK
jgi:hypothetical protein